MADRQHDPAAHYTGLVARIYRHLRSETFDPEPYARFVTKAGQPALELGCGDGDPILDLRSRGLDVEGVDSSADMLARCRAEAQARGVDVVLHHAAFQTMELGRAYRSMYLAGGTFNLLPDDAAALAALRRMVAHLVPGGSALIPLFVPDADQSDHIGHTRQHVADDGSIMRFTVVSVEHDVETRLQITRQRYELVDGDDVQILERDWLVHWFEQQQFRDLAVEAGFQVRAVLAAAGGAAAPDATSFTFLLQRDERQPDETGFDDRGGALIS